MSATPAVPQVAADLAKETEAKAVVLADVTQQKAVDLADVTQQKAIELAVATALRDQVIAQHTEHLRTINGSIGDLVGLVGDLKDVVGRLDQKFDTTIEVMGERRKRRLAKINMRWSALGGLGAVTGISLGILSLLHII
jgi:hypothetical protein